MITQRARSDGKCSREQDTDMQRHDHSTLAFAFFIAFLDFSDFPFLPAWAFFIFFSCVCAARRLADCEISRACTLSMESKAGRMRRGGRGARNTSRGNE